MPSRQPARDLPLATGCFWHDRSGTGVPEPPSAANPTMVHQKLEATDILVERPGPAGVGRLEFGDLQRSKWTASPNDRPLPVPAVDRAQVKDARPQGYQPTREPVSVRQVCASMFPAASVI